MGEFGGVFPEARAELRRLPGVGEATSGALAVYAFNQPEVFIETNVRTVFFHHFFTEGDKVDDSEITVLLSDVLDNEHPREFYWALMDYGTWLKKQGAGKITQSRHYKKQSPLKGSLREMRGMIIRSLAVGEQELHKLEGQFKGDQRFSPALAGLERDGLIGRTDSKLHLTK